MTYTLLRSRTSAMNLCLMSVQNPVAYKFDSEYARFLLALGGKIMFLVSAIGVICFGPHQLQKIVKK